jgi:hypothetical protein
MDHDQNYKNLILDYPREALALYAEQEAQAIDPDARVLPVREEQLKEHLGDRFRELDVPLLVEWSDGRRQALVFVLENESDPQRFSMHRLGHYCLDLSELLHTHRVVPVVIFLRGGSQERVLALGSEHHTYLRLEYIYRAHREMAYAAYRDSTNLVARLNLPNMRYAPEQRLEVYHHAVQGLLTLEPDPEKRLKYLDFIDIYAELDDNERVEYERRYPQEAETMSSFAERFIEQGEQRGRQEGVQQGEAAIVLHLMERRFGPLPEEARRRVETADAKTLRDWSERILTARTIDEVLH